VCVNVFLSIFTLSIPSANSNKKTITILVVVVSFSKPIVMDSDEDTYDNVDSGNESSGDDVDFAMEVEVTGHREKQTDADDYPYEVLSTEEIVQHMVDSIKEVNSVVEISTTTTRILLNHFRWDKEKLMERFYDGDQDQLFSEARVINPFNKYNNKVKV
jgi:ariadne-1